MTALPNLIWEGNVLDPSGIQRGTYQSVKVIMTRGENLKVLMRLTDDLGGHYWKAVRKVYGDQLDLLWEAAVEAAMWALHNKIDREVVRG